MTGRRAALLLAAALAAGCAGTAPEGVLTRGGGGSVRPKTIGLLYPQVEPGAVGTTGTWPGGRRFMGSEMGAVVHVAARGALDRVSRIPVTDLSAQAPVRERVALLTTAIMREYSLNGRVPPPLANELGRVTHLDAALLVSITRFGPSERQLVLRSVAGDARASGPAGGWINCGVACAVVRTPGGELLWEGSAVESLPAADHTQEAAAQGCVTRLLAAFPWRR